MKRLIAALALVASLAAVASPVVAAGPYTSNVDGQVKALTDIEVNTRSASSGVAQGSTTSGQSGNLVQCAVTTAAPTYTTGTTNPCSVDTAGNLRTTGAVTLSGTLPAFASTPTVNNVPGGSADGAQTTITLTSTTPSAVFDMRYYDYGVLQFTGVGSGNTIAVQCSNDGTPGTGSTFAPAPFWYYGGSAIASVVSLVGPSTGTMYYFPGAGTACRLTATTYGSGTITAYVTRKRGALPAPSQLIIGTTGNGPAVQGAGTFGTPTGGVFSTQPGLAGLTPAVVTVASSSLVVKNSAGKLYSAGITTGASAGYLLIYNATSAPADGTVTPQACISVPANTTWMNDFVTAGIPETYTTGIVMVFSTGASCFSQTASSTAFLRAKYQ